MTTFIIHNYYLCIKHLSSYFGSQFADVDSHPATTQKGCGSRLWKKLLCHGGHEAANEVRSHRGHTFSPVTLFFQLDPTSEQRTQVQSSPVDKPSANHFLIDLTVSTRSIGGHS